MRQDTKNGFQKLVLLIRSPKDQRKVFFLRMNHLSSYVLRMMKDLHSKLSFSKQGNNKKLDDMILQGYHKMRSSFEGGNERNSSSCNIK